MTLAPTLELFFFDAGGGHRSAATSLQKTIAEKNPDWRVKLVNLQELLLPVDPFHRLFNVESQDIYNKALKNGLTYGGGAILTTLQAGIRLYAPRIEALLRDHWRLSAPDLVVSLIPNFNALMANALQDMHPGTPYVTVMTDIADCPPRFWQETPEHFIICGSKRAATQAAEAGYAPHHIFRTSGMILKPDFYNHARDDRRGGRQKLGLDPDRPVALIMFGGNGSRASAKIAARLRKTRPDLQYIVMCGKNEALREKLQKYPHCCPVGFTDKVADYMALADFFIGKPGPGSLSEALHMGLPVIVEEGLRTMPQERYNATWIRENALGLTIKSLSDIGEAVDELLAGDRLAVFRRNALALDNRALYEVPALLSEILSGAETVQRRLEGNDIYTKEAEL